MKYYLGPIVFTVLLLAVASAAYSFTNKGYTAAVQRKLQADQNLAQWKANFAKNDAQLKEAQRLGVGVNKFLAQWSTFANEGNDPGQVGATLAELAKNVGLAGNRRPTPHSDDYPFEGNQIQVQLVPYAVTGEYRVAMDWLGKVEQRYPYARIEALTIMAVSSSEVDMVATLAFPIEKEAVK